MEAGDQSEFGPTWYSGIVPLPRPRTALNYDLEVDVCIVGGGLAGLTVARELIARGWSVALLEARRVGWNASGRASGFVVPGFPPRIEKIVERVGMPAAKALWAISEAGLRYVRNAVATLGPTGIMEGEGWLDVAKIPRVATLARARLLSEEIGAEVEAWPVERVRDVLRTRQYFDALHFPRAFHINPLAYALRLADHTERAGAHIFEQTPAIAIDPAGVRKRITTPRGRVRAGRIVLAGNIMPAGAADGLAETLLSITAYTGVTKPLGEVLATAIAYSGAISDSRYGSHHYRIVGGDRLLWTGGGTVKPRRLASMKRSLRRAIGATFPQLGAVAFESFWSGEMGFAVHGMPQIGEVQPGVWLASGFGSHGLGLSAIAGELIARAMVEGDDTWRAFLPYELVWAGGRTGRTVAQATLGWLRRGEATMSFIARRREELQQRRLEHAVKRAEEAAKRASPPAARPAYREIEMAHAPPAEPADPAVPGDVAEVPPMPARIADAAPPSTADAPPSTADATATTQELAVQPPAGTSAVAADAVAAADAPADTV